MGSMPAPSPHAQSFGFDSQYHEKLDMVVHTCNYGGTHL